MSTRKFEEFLNENDLKITILESPRSTHTAQQAADVHGVPVRNIVKSILVKIDSEFFLFLIPGDKRIDLKEKQVEFKAKKCRVANADEVKNITGYSIGGVPPFGHKRLIKTFIEKGFDKKGELLAAAGSPNTVFKISLQELTKLTLVSQQHH